MGRTMNTMEGHQLSELNRKLGKPFMKLNRRKGFRLIREEHAKYQDLVAAYFVLEGDESYNKECVWIEGKRFKDYETCFRGSMWATPQVLFEYADGRYKRLPIFTEVRSEV